jgi:hypothetical protein
MSVEVSERSLEEAIECGLLRYGPDACPDAATDLREAPQRPYGDVISYRASIAGAVRRITIAPSVCCRGT